METSTVEKRNHLETTPIVQLIIKMSIPTVLAQLVQLLYNVVDRVYIGRIGEDSSLALAGLGIAFPIISIIIAFAAFVGTGGATRAAIAMGAKDTEKAEKLLGNSISLIFMLSIILTAVFLVYKEPILYAFGASEDTIDFATGYLSIYLWGTIFVQATLGLNAFITNQGFAKTSMMTVVIGCALNIILDPIFIFGLNMGVKGAALATVISQSVSAIWVVSFLLSKKSLLKIRIKNLFLSKAIVVSIASLGISVFIMNSTESLIQLVFNKGMQTYGGDMHVALMSILFSIMQLVFLPISGLGQGAQPVMSYNFGAKNVQRAKDAYKCLLKIICIFSFSLVGFIIIFPQFFIGIFTPDQDLIALGIPTLRIFIIGMALMGVQSACQQAFVATGNAKMSVFLAVLRKIILLVPLALTLPHLFGLGYWGVIIAEPISDCLSATTAAILFFVNRKKIFIKKD